MISGNPNYLPPTDLFQALVKYFFCANLFTRQGAIVVELECLNNSNNLFKSYFSQFLNTLIFLPFTSQSISDSVASQICNIPINLELKITDVCHISVVNSNSL